MLKGWKYGLMGMLLLCNGSVWAGTILVVGDSISAAFGVESSQGWVALLSQQLVREKHDYQVVNASVSGETSAGGLLRLPGLLAEYQPEVVVVELGGNDGLRGLPPVKMKQNLTAMIRLSREAGARVLVLGMRMPPNLGVRFTKAYAQAFDSLAAEQAVAYVPFFLQGIGGVADMMQEDGIHPSLKAQPLLLANVWPALLPLLVNE